MARRCPDWWPEEDEDYEVARVELKKRFAQWRAAAGLDAEKDAGEAPIHYKWAYVDGHLTRWRCADLDEVYLELHPAKVMVDDEDLDDVLEEAKTFIRFLDETALLDPESDPADVLVDHLDAIDGRFRKNMADSSRYSFGKRLWTSAQAAGVCMDDRASVEAVLGRGPGHSQRPSSTGRVTAPGTQPKAPSAKRRKRRR